MRQKSEVNEYQLEIREKDIDMLGHVNNATYLTLYEEARWAMIAPRGWGKEDILRRRLSPIVLDVQISFRRELRLGEKVLVRTWCHDPLRKTCHVSQVMLKADGKEASSATFTMALFNLDNRKLVDPPQDWIETIGLAD